MKKNAQNIKIERLDFEGHTKPKALKIKKESYSLTCDDCGSSFANKSNRNAHKLYLTLLLCSGHILVLNI